MLRRTLSLLVGLSLTLAGCGSSASSSTTPQPAHVSAGATEPTSSARSRFVGAWQVTWLDNYTVNALTLDVQEDQLVGWYVSDDGEECPVHEGVSPTGAALHITVECSRWDIVMEGTPTDDGHSVEGTFLAYGNSRGRFVMSR